MKCILLIDCESVNPRYFVERDKTGITPILTLPEGTVIDDPDAWRLCVIGKASPHDDECVNRVKAFLGNPGRLALLGKIRALMAAEGVQKLDAKTQRWLDHMKKSYATDLGLEPAAE